MLEIHCLPAQLIEVGEFSFGIAFGSTSGDQMIWWVETPVVESIMDFRFDACLPVFWID